MLGTNTNNGRGGGVAQRKEILEIVGDRTERENQRRRRGSL